MSKREAITILMADDDDDDFLLTQPPTVAVAALLAADRTMPDDGEAHNHCGNDAAWLWARFSPHPRPLSLWGEGSV